MAETRVIEGSISANGTILDGTGFTVTHENTGVYTVHFDERFYYAAPSIATLEINNPYQDPYGYKIQVIGKPTTSQFRYFTFEIQDHELTMKDIDLDYFYIWGYKKPDQ